MLRPEAQSQGLVLIDEVCLELFDGWCEQRNVVALAYLMHGWPLIGNDVSLVRRLLQSLRELERYHRDALLEKDVVLLSVLWDELAV